MSLIVPLFLHLFHVLRVCSLARFSASFSLPRAHAANVTLASLTLLRSLTLLGAPKVYIQCDGGSQIALTDVNTILLPYTFTGTEPWQVRCHCCIPHYLPSPRTDSYSMIVTSSPHRLEHTTSTGHHASFNRFIPREDDSAGDAQRPKRRTIRPIRPSLCQSSSLLLPCPL